MKTEITYLSDEELEQLIFTVEQQELVAAPPELLDRILEEVEKTQESNKASNDKVREFRSYCFRVLTSVAAAIVIVFLVPGLQNVQLQKEEVMRDAGILTRTLGGVNIFENDNRLNIFNETNGGIFNETKER